MPPSAWVKREHRYRQDLEKLEHTVAMQRERIAKLEAEVSVLREGGVANLEERIEVGWGGSFVGQGCVLDPGVGVDCKIVVKNSSVLSSHLSQGALASFPPPKQQQELEQQLKSTAEEKVQVQSKFHELSIKHRQLIETSPQIATIWKEVLIQQQQQQQTAGRNATSMSCLTSFDLRHTGASDALEHVPSSGLYNSGAAAAAVASSGFRRTGSMTAANAAAYPALLAGPALPPLRTSPAATTPPRGTAAALARARRAAGASGAFFEADGSSAPSSASSSSAPEPDTPPPDGEGARATLRAGSVDSPMVLLGGGQRLLMSAEEKASALMASVQLEGLTPDAKISALQQLNYDLTMQLELYQRMVGRLKDCMEHADMVKAELEIDKQHLETQVAQMTAAADGTVRRWGSGILSRLRATAAGFELGAVADATPDAQSQGEGAEAGAASSEPSPTTSSDAKPAEAPAPAAGDPAAPSQSGALTRPARLLGLMWSRGGAAAEPRTDNAATSEAADQVTAKQAAANLAKELEETRSENQALVQALVAIKLELADVQGGF